MNIKIEQNDLGIYEKQNNRLSYYNLVHNYFNNIILCNDIIKEHELELVSKIPSWEDLDEDEKKYYGDEDEYYFESHNPECYQYYIVNFNSYDEDKIISNPNIILFYCYDLNLYILGVTHYGTNWDYVLTNIKLDDIEII